MSEAVIIEIIKIVGILASLIISGIISIRLGKLSHHINSRMDQLLLETQKASKAEGKVEGKAEEKEKHKIEVVETHSIPAAGTTNLDIVEGKIKVKTETKKK